MDLLIPAGLMSLILGAVVVAFAWSARRYRRLERAWEDWARARGHRFVPHTGPNNLFPSMGKPYEVTGSIAGWPFQMTGGLCKERPFAAIKVPLGPLPRCPFSLSIRQRSAGDFLIRTFAGPEIPTGDPAFDAAFAMWTDAPDIAPFVLGPARRATLIAQAAAGMQPNVTCQWGLLRTGAWSAALADYPDPSRRPNPELSSIVYPPADRPDAFDLAVAIACGD